MAKILNEACPLTGQLAEIVEDSSDAWLVTGYYTDGTYRIARSVIPAVRTYDGVFRAKIVTWVVDQHRLGNGAPLITSSVLNEVQLWRPLTYDQKVRRFFLMLRSAGFGLGMTLRFSGIVDEKLNRDTGRAWAWLEITNGTELTQALSAMQDENLLKLYGDSWSLPAGGLRKLDSLSDNGPESDQAFVAMWFSETLSDAYVAGFESGIRDAGYRALRIDKKEHANKIDDEIIAEIRRSRFIVADFTCELLEVAGFKYAVPRGGVYYEAGFAQGIGVPVLWTVRADCIDYVHFDTRQYAHIVWSDPDDLRAKLRNRIGAVIGPPQRT